MTDGLSPETLAAQALGTIDPASGAVSPPIHPSTIYEQNADGSSPAGLAYTRADNPTYDHAERLLTALEGGAACMLFSSGMAAATAVFQSLLPGDHVLVSRILYWGIRKWLAEFGVAWGLDVEFLDTGDVTALRAAIRPGRTRLLWVETPANPTWEITDLRAVAEVARAADVRLVVDSTIATPVLTRPIEFGADLVVRAVRSPLPWTRGYACGGFCRSRPMAVHTNTIRLPTRPSPSSQPNPIMAIMSGPQFSLIICIISRSPSSAGRRDGQPPVDLP